MTFIFFVAFATAVSTCLSARRGSPRLANGLAAFGITLVCSLVLATFGSYGGGVIAGLGLLAALAVGAVVGMLPW